MAAATVKEVDPLPRATRLPTRDHSQSTLDDGRILVCGGHENAKRRKDVYLYNPATNRWSAAASMPQPRYCHAQTPLSHLALVCGGSTDKDFYSAMAQVFDPRADQWMPVAPMKTPRRNHSASNLTDGRAIVCGGQAHSGTIAEVEIYDPHRDSWTRAASMPVPMDSHTQSTLVDGQVLVCGQNAQKVPTMCIYDPTSDRWTKAALPKGLVGTQHASQTTLADGRVLVIGGLIDGKRVRTSALYTPATAKWSRGPDLPTSHSQHAASVYQSRNILVSGGCAGKGRVYLVKMALADHTNTVDSSRESHVATVTQPAANAAVQASYPRDNTDNIDAPHMQGSKPRWPPTEQHRGAWNGISVSMAANDSEIAVRTETMKKLTGDKEVAVTVRNGAKDQAQAGRVEAERRMTQAEARVAELERANLSLREQLASFAKFETLVQGTQSSAAVIAANADDAEAASSALVDKLRAHVADAPRLSLDIFKIIGRIGERSRPTTFHQFYGVNSAVFEAVLDGRVVVIKVVYNVEQATDSNLSTAFTADYAFIEDLSRNHPNVVAGLGHFVGEASQRTLGKSWDANPDCVRLNTLFIVMEPMEESLKKLITKLASGRSGASGDSDVQAWPPVLPMPVFKVMIQRLLRGLVSLFRHGIVHRDLKADNVLINYTPAHTDRRCQPTVLVKLADFGHALDTTFHPSIVNFRMPYLVDGVTKGGAAAYLAPEVVNAKAGTIDDPVYIDYSKNDVFAAGMLAHYMLTNGMEDAFATRDPDYAAVHHPHYSAATYNHPPRDCPKPIADLVWAMVNPSFEQRVTAEEALARVDAMIYDSTSWN